MHLMMKRVKLRRKVRDDVGLMDKDVCTPICLRYNVNV